LVRVRATRSVLTSTASSVVTPDPLRASLIPMPTRERMLYGRRILLYVYIAIISETLEADFIYSSTT
jgi:hypothetical protein